MVRLSPSIEQRKQFYNCEANDLVQLDKSFMCFHTCQQISYMVKQLNYVWLTTEITWHMSLAYVFLSLKFYCDIINRTVYSLLTL